MNKHRWYAVALTFLFIPFVRPVPAWALGDKVVPHVVDGIQSGGDFRYRTKFDITCLSYNVNTPLSKVTLLFYRPDGTPWTIATKNQGTTSAVSINLSSAMTMRVETLGLSDPFGSGYAILRNLETAYELPDDNEVSLTVFYEVLARNSSGGYDVVDTVSVPVGKPTVSWGFPVEIDLSQDLNTGFAVASLIDGPNTVTIDMYDSGGFQYGTTVSYVLNNGVNPKKTASFLNQAGFFPGISNFKGMAFLSSTGPVSFLALLQTKTPGGVQFATMEAAYLDSLRHNTMMYLPQGFSLDADLPMVDYFRNEQSDPDTYYETPWDLLFETSDATGARRMFTAMNGAQFAKLNATTADDFDLVTLEDLRGLTYTSDSIDMSDGSANRAPGFCFAIKTGLGQYVKVRVREVITFSSGSDIDLGLEIFVYK